MRVKQESILKWGLYFNSMYIFFLFLFMPDGINIQNIVITSTLLFSVFLIFSVCLKNWKTLRVIPQKIRILFYALIFWGCLVVIRSFSLVIQDWMTNFGNIYTAYAWLMPLTLILGLKISNWTIVFKAISMMFSLMILAFLLLPFFSYNEEWILLLRPLILLLLLGVYRFKNLFRFKTYFIILLYLISVLIITSRRIDLLFLGFVLLFIIIDKVSSVSLKKSFLKYIFACFLVVLTLIFTIGYEYVSNFISMLIDFQDSRTFLFTELFADMSVSEQFFGRGSLGTYYSQFFEGARKYWENMGRVGWPGDAADRITIEVGYLQMILKGGFTLLILNLSIYSYAIYVALFKSNNRIIKRLGYYILIVTILSIVEFRPTFTPMFIILWMAIGTVLNKKYRQMDNNEIEALIKFK